MPDDDLQDAGTDIADAPDDSVADAPVETPGASEAVETDPWDNEETSQFDRSYVKKLRDENASYRKRYQPYEKSFSSLHADDAEYFRTLVDAWGRGDPQAAEMLWRAAEAGGERFGFNPYAQPEPTPDYYDAPMTQGQFEQFMAQREQAQYEEQSQQAIFAKTKELGFTPDAEPGSTDHYQYVALLMEARANGGDLDGAAKAIKDRDAEREQTAINAYLERKRQDAAGTTVTPQDGGAPTGRKPIRNMEEAWQAAEAHLEALQP